MITSLPPPPACLYCEQRPPEHHYGLCGRCARQYHIRTLYRRRVRWTPDWELHLRRLTERAKRKLPLFDDV